MPTRPQTPANPTAHSPQPVELTPLPWRFLVFGVLLPVATLVFESWTRMCASEFFDPLRTPVHALWVAEVPLCLGWVWAVSRRKTPPHPRLQSMAAGMALMTCIFYAVLFIPIMPLAVFALMMGLGIFPLAPALALWMAARAVGTVRKLRAPPWYLGLGVGLSLAGMLGADLPQVYTRWALSRAVSDDKTVALDGVQMLRRYADRELLIRHAYQRNAGAKDLFSMALALNHFVTPERARDIYFRVYGEAFNAQPPPAWTGHHRWDNEEWAWDSDQASSDVGGHLKGLTLAGSRLDVSADPDAGLAYTEWTLEFHNSGVQQREARGEVLLPPGSVVSRATLWVDGEERDAAVASTGDARKAYQSVVRTRRDPLLVTQAAPDRVLVQCFPVPVGGSMKIRLGITTALRMDTTEATSLFLPLWSQRNFAFAPDLQHAAWVETHHGIHAEAPWHISQPAPNVTTARAQFTSAQLQDPSVRLTLDRNASVTRAWAADGAQTVTAELRRDKPTLPVSVAVVVDGSVSMAPHAASLLRALEALPAGVPTTVLMAADRPRVLLPMTPWNDQARAEVARTLHEVPWVGGQDNQDALLLAVEALNPSSGVLIWLHGAQVMTPSTGALDQWLERTSARFSLVDLQPAPGPNRLMESLSRHFSVVTVRNAGCVAESLDPVLRAFSTPQLNWTRQHGNPEGHATSSHLVRLWAAGEITGLQQQVHNPPAHQAALKLAVEHRLVTTVSGMVVLETAQQEKDQGLTPADPNQVPAVPEPGVVMLMAMVLAAGAAWVVRQRRRAWAAR